MKSIEIFNQQIKIGKDKYNFIIDEVWFDNLGHTKKKRPKFYSIKKNGECILSTSLHQTWYARKKQILGRV